MPQFAAAAGLVDELSGVHLGWGGVAVGASALTYVGATTGMLGAVPVRLRFSPVMTAQLASSFTNRVTPAKVGGMATNVRYLQKHNLTLPMAASAIGFNTLAGTIIHVALLAVTAVAAGRTGEFDLPTPDARITAIIVAGLIVLSGFVMVLPAGRKLATRYLLPALEAAVSTAAPTPGGLGATEAALVAGYTAVGVAGSTAFTAVLLFRLVTFWLPILPGWLALVLLQRRGDL